MEQASACIEGVTAVWEAETRVKAELDKNHG